MGKRSNFERKGRDFYPTPYEGVLPLLPYLEPGRNFVEPCAGNGSLIRHLGKHGHDCVYACDILPDGPGIEQRDVLFFSNFAWPKADYYITNPPWKRELLHPMIDIFREQAPTWLLMDAGWKHSQRAAPFLKYCSLIVSVGRISWEGNGVSGKDDCCWYLFINEPTDTIFKGRT